MEIIELERVFSTFPTGIYLTKGKCICLLAWLYVYGGGQEAACVDARLSSHLLYAQRRLGLEGGLLPALDVVQGIKLRIAECRQQERPAWLLELCAEYRVKAQKGEEI